MRQIPKVIKTIQRKELAAAWLNAQGKTRQEVSEYILFVYSHGNFFDNIARQIRGKHSISKALVYYRNGQNKRFLYA